MNKKICVYTCITGDYDDLKEIKNIEKNIDYYCFTNNKKIKSKTWNIIYIEDSKLSNVLLARKTKIIGNPIINEKYNILVWMDAAVEFKKPIIEFVNEYLNKNDSFVCFKHGLRNSIKEEMDACLRFRKESIDNIENLKKFYEKENYKYDNGLVESTVLIKRAKDKKVKETMDLWFDMIKKYSKRDQLSFNYCINKTGLNVKWVNEYVFDNGWFKWHEHSTSRFPNNYMLYFGNIDKYNYKNQFNGNYNINDDEFIIEKIVEIDTNEIYVELSNVPMIKYEINCNYNIDYHNTIDYDNKKLFFKLPGFIIIKNDFKKGDLLKLSIKFELLEDYEKNEIIESLIKDRLNNNEKLNDLMFKFNDLKGAYSILEKAYSDILNSTSWKLTKPIRKISKIIKK